MTNKTSKIVNPFARPAESFHWLVTGVMWHARPVRGFAGYSEISTRGQTVTITAEMLEASPWIVTYLGDPEGQMARWGEVRIAPGPFPDNVSRWVHGAPDWEEAREDARRRAWAIADPEERAAARAAVEREFGPALPTSKHQEIREHYTERAVREQAERRARGVVDRKH